MALSNQDDHAREVVGMDREKQVNIIGDACGQQESEEEPQFGITVGSIMSLSPLGNRVPPQILQTQAKIGAFEFPSFVDTSAVALKAVEGLGQLEYKELPPQILENKNQLQGVEFPTLLDATAVVLKGGEALGQLEHKVFPPQILESQAQLQGFELPILLDPNAISGTAGKLKYKPANIGVNIDGRVAEMDKAEDASVKAVAPMKPKQMQEPRPLSVPVLPGVANTEGSAMHPMMVSGQDGKEPVRKTSHHRSPIWTQESLKMLSVVLCIPKAVQPSGLLYSSTKNRAECVLPRARIQGLAGLRPLQVC